MREINLYRYVIRSTHGAYMPRDTLATTVLASFPIVLYSQALTVF